MSLKLGNNDVTKVMLGSTEVSAVYKGTDEVWSSGADGPVFGAKTYLGTGLDGNKITNGADLRSGGLIWIKNRASDRSHALFDHNRGPTTRWRLIPTIR